jgi:hypothetical protein
MFLVGITIKREDGIAMPAFAIQAILRSQIELAMGGNVRAQRKNPEISL